MQQPSSIKRSGLALLCLFVTVASHAADLVSLYPRAQLFDETGFHATVMIDDYHPEAALSPEAGEVDRHLSIRLQKNADGGVELGYIEEAIPYLGGQVHIALILDGEHRLRKAVVVAATPDIADIFQGVTKQGLITRYTATSVRQLKYLYKIQKDKAPAVAFLGREVWVLGAILVKNVFQAR